MFDRFMSILAALNTNVLWGVPMVVLMLGTGVFLLIITKGVVFTRFNVVMRYTTMTLFRRGDARDAGEGTISPFQAVCTALAATLGTGNIVGVALAVATGGPGAIFWLWLSALAGMVIKFCEVTLSVAYRTRNERGEIVGGPCTTSPAAWAPPGWRSCSRSSASSRLSASARACRQTPLPPA